MVFDWGSLATAAIPLIGSLFGGGGDDDDAPANVQAYNPNVQRWEDLYWSLVNNPPANAQYTFGGQPVQPGAMTPFEYDRGQAPSALGVDLSGLQQATGALGQMPQFDYGTLQNVISQIGGMRPELAGTLASIRSAAGQQPYDEQTRMLESAYQQLQGQPMGYSPAEIEAAKGSLRSELQRESDASQRTLRARYGASGLRGGAAISAAMKAEGDTADRLARGITDVDLGAAEARRQDIATRGSLGANLLGLRGQAAAGGADYLRNILGLESGAAQNLDAATLAQLAGQGQLGTSLLGAQQEGARLGEVARQGRAEMESRLAGLRGDDVNRALQAMQLGEQQRQFNVGQDATSWQLRNRIAETLAAQPQQNWNTQTDAISRILTGLAGASSQAAGQNRQWMTENANQQSNVWQGIANAVGSMFPKQTATAATPQSTVAGYGIGDLTRSFLNIPNSVGSWLPRFNTR